MPIDGKFWRGLEDEPTAKEEKGGAQPDGSKKTSEEASSGQGVEGVVLAEPDFNYIPPVGAILPEED